MLKNQTLLQLSIATCLQTAYELEPKEISLLPLGADFNTEVYRVIDSNNASYFLKLRRASFSETSLTIPAYLSTREIPHILSPLATTTGQLWTHIAGRIAILYPYIQGKTAVERPLSEKQWIALGATLRKIHATVLPNELARNVTQETFSLHWVHTVRQFLERIENEHFHEPIAKETAAFLKSKKKNLLAITHTVGELATSLHTQSLEYVVCHADLHGWNILIDEKSEMYIIDWDMVMLAPKERDLMFIGAGISPSGRTALEENTLFYKGYGPTTINHDAITYYRYARIIEDIGQYCQHIFLSGEGEAERTQSLLHLQANFLLDGTIDRASQSVAQ